MLTRRAAKGFDRSRQADAPPEADRNVQSQKAQASEDGQGAPARDRVRHRSHCFALQAIARGDSLDDAMMDVDNEALVGEQSTPAHVTGASVSEHGRRTDVPSPDKMEASTTPSGSGTILRP